MPQQPTNQNRGRRMPDKLLDAAAQAVRMERLEGQQTLLAQQLKTSVDNMTSTLHAVQAEARGIASRLNDVTSLQQQHDYSKAAIDEMRRSIVDLNQRLEEWFSDFDNRNQKRWSEYERQRDEWRHRHEADNENTERTLSGEIRSVRETVIRALGWGAGAGALVTVVVGGFIWSLNFRFTELSGDIARAESTSAYNRTLIDKQIEKTHEIELYLARGGVNRYQPFVTQQQRQNNGTGKP